MPLYLGNCPPSPKYHINAILDFLLIFYIRRMSRDNTLLNILVHKNSLLYNVHKLTKTIIGNRYKIQGYIYNTIKLALCAAFESTHKFCKKVSFIIPSIVHFNKTLIKKHLTLEDTCELSYLE